MSEASGVAGVAGANGAVGAGAAVSGVSGVSGVGATGASESVAGSSSVSDDSSATKVGLNDPGSQMKGSGVEQLGQNNLDKMPGNRGVEKGRDKELGNINNQPQVTPRDAGRVSGGNQNISIETRHESYQSQRITINFNDNKLSDKLFDKLADKIDKDLMLAILLAIKEEEKDELIQLLELAFAISAMEKLGNMIDMQG